MKVNLKNNSILVSTFILSVAMLVSFYLVVSAAFEEIEYPIAGLGGCENEKECRVFCDEPKNMEACVAFAKKHKLISDEEAGRTEKFIEAGGKGPGGCDSADSCESYCNDATRINECIAFAEKNGMMSPKELNEARKVKAALDGGAKLPGGCRNKNDCDNYCNDSSHVEECITFAKEAGFIEGDELAEAEKVLVAVKKGAKPPPCRGKEKCDAYCGEENHFEECMAFAEAAGFMTAEETQMVRKTGGKGPGNCRGKEECESFCNNPENGEICFNFAKEHGLISESELKEMEQGKSQMRDSLNQAPPETVECLTQTVGAEMFEKMKSGAAMPNREFGDKMRECFSKMMPGDFGPKDGMGGGGPEGFGPGGPPPGFEGNPPIGGFGRPGGCKTPEECKGFGPPQEGDGGMPPFESRDMPPQGDGQFQGPPPGYLNQPPAQEQLQQYQQQYQEQYQQQYEQYQQGPPPGGGGDQPPQSQLNPNLGTFIANFLSLFFGGAW